MTKRQKIKHTIGETRDFIWSSRWSVFHERVDYCGELAAANKVFERHRVAAVWPPFDPYFGAWRAIPARLFRLCDEGEGVAGAAKG